MSDLDSVEGRPADDAEEVEPGGRDGVGAHQPLPVHLQPRGRLAGVQVEAEHDRGREAGPLKNVSKGQILQLVLQ